jgi:hypothetical protein
MNKLNALALALLVSFGLVPQVSGAPQVGGRERQENNRDRVCVYQDIQYRGWEQCYNAGDEIGNFERRNNAISSIRIFGRARVMVYENTEFRGRSAEFDTSVPDLGLRNMAGSRSWSDHIQSMRISGGPGYIPRGGGLEDRRPGGDLGDRRTNGPLNGRGICVYDRRNYEGREQCFDLGADVRDLARSGNWSDRIASIRVFGRTSAILYRDIEYRGESLLIDRDIPDLSQVSGNNFRNWDRQASSLVVENGRGVFPGRGLGRGRGRGLQ